MNLESWTSLVMGRRWLTIVLSLLVLTALAYGARYIVLVDVDVRNHFNQDDPHLIALELLEVTYALSDSALVAVAPQEGTIFTREALLAIEELTEELWRTPYVEPAPAKSGAVSRRPLPRPHCTDANLTSQHPENHGEWLPFYSHWRTCLTC